MLGLLVIAAMKQYCVRDSIRNLVHGSNEFFHRFASSCFCDLRIERLEFLSRVRKILIEDTWLDVYAWVVFEKKLLFFGAFIFRFTVRRAQFGL